MARSQRNSQVDDGRRSPPTEEEKEEGVEEEDESNGVVQENDGGVQGGNNARGMATNVASMIAMLGKIRVPHLQTGLATMWN